MKVQETHWMFLQTMQGRRCLFHTEGQVLSQLCRVPALCHHPGDTAVAGREQVPSEGAQVCRPWCVPAVLGCPQPPGQCPGWQQGGSPPSGGDSVAPVKRWLQSCVPPVPCLAPVGEPLTGGHTDSLTPISPLGRAGYCLAAGMAAKFSGKAKTNRLWSVTFC